MHISLSFCPRAALRCLVLSLSFIPLALQPPCAASAHAQDVLAGVASDVTPTGDTGAATPAADVVTARAGAPQRGHELLAGAREPAEQRERARIHITSVSTNYASPRAAAGAVEAALDDTLSVSLSPGGVAALESAAEQKGVRYGLFLGGRFVTEPLHTDPANEELTFQLARSADNGATIDLLLAHQLLQNKRTPIAIGLSNGQILATNPATTLRFRAFDGPEAVIVAAVAFLFLTLTIMLARRTPMLRDTIGNLAGRSWSLGRVQMAIWFSNIVIAYLFLWSVCGATPAVTTSVLALLGIGAGTALGSASIDASRKTNEAVPDAAGPEAGTPRRGAIIASNFWVDILREHGTESVSFHRYQMVIWTVIMCFVFWGSVVHSLRMPDLDNVFLALQGITAGTYLGFKLPGATRSETPA